MATSFVSVRRRISLRGTDEWELDGRIGTFLDALKARGGVLRQIDLLGRDPGLGFAAVVAFDIPLGDRVG